LPPRFTSPWSQFRNSSAYARFARRPSGLTLGTAAAVVAVAGVSAGVVAGPATGAGAVSMPSVISRQADIGHTAASAGDPIFAAASGLAPFGHATAQTAVTLRPQQPAVGVPAASGEHPRHQSVGQHPAGSQPKVTAHDLAKPHSAPARHSAAPARPAQPYLMYDSVTPGAIPTGHVVATYATGPYAVSAAQVAGRRSVLWIDTNGTDPRAGALDVEPGDATPALAASWARQKLSAEPNGVAILYTMQSEWPAVQAAVAALPSWMHSHIRWWIADPTGYPHIVPGSDATQWYWGSSYDITTASPRF